MDSNLNSANEGLPRRATDWLIALADHPDDAGLAEGHRSWLAASPENQRDWDEMNHTWQGLGEIGPLIEKGGEIVEFPHRPAGRSRRHVLSAVACLALLVSAVVVWNTGLLTRWQADRMTGAAELQQVVLDDGTRVVLAPQSAIDIDFTDSARRIRLLQGQAFFIVGPGDRRQFVVAAGDVEARDIGTEFDVRNTGRGAEIGVREGVVDVSVPGVTLVARLQAGDWVGVAGREIGPQKRLDPDQIGAWRNGRLTVQDQPVSAVVDAIRPYFAGSIILIGNRLAQEPITGAYNLHDPVGALRAVALAQGAEIYRVSPWLIVVTAQ